MLAETVDKLPDMQAALDENVRLKQMLRETQAYLDTVNKEQSLVQENLNRRSHESNFGRIRQDYETHRDSGHLRPDEEIAFLKEQLKALENDANRAAVAEARAKVCNFI